jgi:tetratricopeptide (TPR) repeat protein
MPGNTGRDPIASPFGSLWQDPPDNVTHMEIEIATLLAEDAAHAAEAVPDLVHCSRPECEAALVAAYTHIRKFREALAVAERLARKHPSSERAFGIYADALMRLRAIAQFRLLVSQWLRTHPDHKVATDMFGHALLMSGDGQGYERELRHLIDAGKADSAIYNQIAWLALFLRTVDDDDVALARKAVELSERRSRPELNTLAAVLADRGKVAEARDVLVESWRWMGVDGPQVSDFYVLGRIAEQVGRRAEAIDFYRKEPALPPGASPELSAYLLAQKRLAVLNGR